MNRLIFIFFGTAFVSLATFLQSCKQPETTKPSWPTIERETKPWTRWWWHGSAVTKEGITHEMEAYKLAGLGGLEITPIYGVYGGEDQFVDYLSPEWMELLMHTLKEAERLDMGIDMATGTGWPFGGPWVTSEDACKNINCIIYEIKGGKSLTEKIEFIQQPFLRAVGNQIYEVHDYPGGELVKGSRKEPLLRVDPKELQINQLVEPIAANKNLQALALDQVKFEKMLPLKLLMGYNDTGEALDLTANVDPAGKLNWLAPAGNWKLYALFEGWHGKMVERAAPGGEGNVIDHFSLKALENYLKPFDKAFNGKDVSSLRAFFNDSYEVDDARGSADWTPMLFDEFKKRRGYDLKQHLPALFGDDTKEINERILCDYRETISELLLANFTLPWKAWAHDKSAVVRNQAHGSPSNILDLYATVDIPEIEGTEPLRIRMAASAGNVTGKKLVSSETATWLNEHFESNLGDIKGSVDNFFLNGINHIFYHGTCYSPPAEVWPGRLFYAAVHLNPRNSQWRDFHTLNEYVARCQSFLQNTKADNDVLLYYPFYDPLSTPGEEMIAHFDGIGKQFGETIFEKAAKTLLESGYTFDYVSDKQIMNLSMKKNSLITEGGAIYKVIVIPHCRYIPSQTFHKLMRLAEEGATVITFKGLPESISGFSDYKNKKNEFNELANELSKKSIISNGVGEVKIAKGTVLSGDSLHLLLSRASVQRETMVDKGLKFIRKRNSNNKVIYFITNTNDTPIMEWMPLSVSSESVILYDPMSGELGKAHVRKYGSEVYLQLKSKQTIFVEMHHGIIEGKPFPYRKTAGVPRELAGPWSVDFLSGGPKLPEPLKLDTLSSWTNFGNTCQAFSGTATYKTSFAKPDGAGSEWLLDLGDVKESAEVLLNGEYVGTLIGPVYQLYLDGTLLKENNTLEVRVSNLMANRIADLDRRGIFWKKFYNVNFPSRKAENRKNGLFNASHWLPRSSGLIGPVRLTRVIRE